MMKVTTNVNFEKFDPTSTNATGNAWTFFMLAIASVFGIGEDVVTAAIAASGPLIFAVREIVRGQRRPRWAGNILTYVLSGITVLLPQFENMAGLLGQLAESISEGGFSGSWYLMLMPILNEAALLWQNRKSRKLQTQSISNGPISLFGPSKFIGTMGNTKTIAVFGLPCMIFDSTVQSTADGEFNGISEFQNYIDDLLAIDPAVKGFAGLDEESAVMSTDDIREIPSLLEAKMPNVSEPLRTNVAQAVSGISAIYRVGFVSGESAGEEDALSSVAALINEGHLTFPGAVPHEGEWTADTVRSLIDERG